MRPISQTITRLSELRTGRMAGIGRPAGRLRRLTDFGSNPGALEAWFQVPLHGAAGAPLVVILHGCTQDAVGYDTGSGWSQLADELGFAVLYPEQRRSNNANLCFNWFEPADCRRGEGEPLSIVQMIEAMVSAHQLDPARVFITGLSAGGAMASIMLATYPEVFAGGAIIAGLPYGAATGTPEALSRMRGQGMPGVTELASAVRQAAPHSGRTPSISLWHGTADHVVVPANADASLAQWLAVHGLGSASPTTEQIDGRTTRRVWRVAGMAVVEDYRISRMGHGTPLAATGPEAIGRPGPHMLEVGISSTRRIAQFWDLMSGSPHLSSAGVARAPAMRVGEALPNDAKEPRAAEPVLARAVRRTAPLEPRVAPTGVGKIIEDALRAAGLMR